MKAVILAAGRGTRMRGICAETPKPMLPLANRPILSVIFSRLKDMGVDEVALVVGFEGQKLKALLGDGSQYGVKVTYVWQEQQLGTGHATQICESFVAGEPFVLIFGDILTRGDNYRAMAELFQRDDCDAVLTVFPVEDPSNGAAVDVKDGEVVGIIEKPPPGTILNAYNNAGIFIWPPEVFDLIRDLKVSPRGEYEFTDGILKFIDLPDRRLGAYELLGYWENITDPEACIRMNQNLLVECLPPESESVDASAEVAADARVRSSTIAAGVTIGPGCRIEDSTIAAGAKIGANVSVRHTEIGPKVVIGDTARLGPYVSVGEDAVIGPGASVGPNVMVGRGGSVGEGASLTSTILLDGASVGAGSSLLHAMLGFGVTVEAGRKIAGGPERAIEVLDGPAQ